MNTNLPLRWYAKALEVTAVYRELDESVKAWQQATGVGCIPGCGVCCEKPNIEATPLEFLPLACELFVSGRAGEWMEILKLAAVAGVCAFYSKDEAAAGKCTIYPIRGLICRLFGFAAMTGKRGDHAWIACKELKDKLGKASTKGLPVASDVAMKLAEIDPDLAMTRFPINVAMLKALEIVGLAADYEGLEKGAL